MSYKADLKDVTGIVHVNILVEGDNRELSRILH